MPSFPRETYGLIAHCAMVPPVPSLTRELASRTEELDSSKGLLRSGDLMSGASGLAIASVVEGVREPMERERG